MIDLLHLRPPLSKKSIDENMTPLINIVFLLLIFFMVAGQISSLSTTNIEPPTSKSSVAASQPLVVLELSADNTLHFNQQIITLLQLPELLSELSPNTNKPKVSVKADKAVRAKDLDYLFVALRKAGVQTITLYAKSAT